MEQADAFLYYYEPWEVVMVVLPEWGATAPDVEIDDYVEVSGQESMWSCGLLCDASGFTVWPELYEDNYIERL